MIVKVKKSKERDVEQLTYVSNGENETWSWFFYKVWPANSGVRSGLRSSEVRTALVERVYSYYKFGNIENNFIINILVPSIV